MKQKTLDVIYIDSIIVHFVWNVKKIYVLYVKVIIKSIKLFIMKYPSLKVILWFKAYSKLTFIEGKRIPDYAKTISTSLNVDENEVFLDGKPPFGRRPVDVGGQLHAHSDAVAAGQDGFPARLPLQLLREWRQRHYAIFDAESDRFVRGRAPSGTIFCVQRLRIGKQGTDWIPET